MNWEAIGAVGEIAGAIAVVLSLVYLATQIGLSRRETQAASRDAISKSMVDIMLGVSADPELSELYGKGLMDPENLSDNETRRFDMVMYATFECFESAFSNWQRGVLTDDDWFKWESTIGTYMSQPGSHSFWDRASQNFNPAFITHVKQVKPNENYVWKDPQFRDGESPESTGNSS